VCNNWKRTFWNSDTLGGCSVHLWLLLEGQRVSAKLARRTSIDWIRIEIAQFNPANFLESYFFRIFGNIWEDERWKAEKPTCQTNQLSINTTRSLGSFDRFSKCMIHLNDKWIHYIVFAPQWWRQTKCVNNGQSEWFLLYCDDNSLLGQCVMTYKDRRRRGFPDHYKHSLISSKTSNCSLNSLPPKKLSCPFTLYLIMDTFSPLCPVSFDEPDMGHSDMSSSFRLNFCHSDDNSSIPTEHEHTTSAITGWYCIIAWDISMLYSRNTVRLPLFFHICQDWLYLVGAALSGDTLRTRNPTLITKSYVASLDAILLFPIFFVHLIPYFELRAVLFIVII